MDLNRHRTNQHGTGESRRRRRRPGWRWGLGRPAGSAVPAGTGHPERDAYRDEPSHSCDDEPAPRRRPELPFRPV